MNTIKTVNLSKGFQVYEGARLLATLRTIAEARRYLTQCTLSAYIVYPRWATVEGSEIPAELSHA